jgi:hypothetical protein
VSPADRLASFKILVGYESNPSSFDDNAVCHYQEAALGASETRTFRCDHIYGRNVIIQIQAVEVLTLCEVQVYGGEG